MGKVIFGMSVSLDGFIEDAQGSVAKLYPDFEAMHDNEIMLEAIANTGAVVMGRRTYEMAHGDYTGYEFQVPLHILTHHAPVGGPKGQNENLKVYFVSDGIESAITQAKAAAGDKDVQIVGGPATGYQALAGGLVDEIHLSLVPVLVGQGLRLFDQPELAAVKLEKLQVLEGGQRTDIKYRVLK